MIKKNRVTLLLTTAVLMLPMLVGILLWDKLPDRIPIHWGLSGEVDGWGSKALAVFGFPLLMMAIHWGCAFATSADPKSKDVGDKPMAIMLWGCPVISLICHTFLFAAALGYTPSVEIVMPAVLGLVFMIIGNYLPKCKRNRTIGIKLYWTLTDDENWTHTHRFAGWVWTLGGAVIAATAIFGNLVITLVLTFLIALLPTLYSYLYYRKHK